MEEPTTTPVLASAWPILANVWREITSVILGQVKNRQHPAMSRVMEAIDTKAKSNVKPNAPVDGWG
jgi:hypothetical protein